MKMSLKPNIFIITFDCLRPDHLSGLGYRGLHTPTFDRLIHEGVVFTKAYCQSPNTWISHASLFTGCNPYRHGVRTPMRKISENVRTMAEVFQKAGYTTFGLPAMSLLSKEAGFARGFDEYCLDGLQSRKGILSHRYYRSASDTLAITKNWLKSVNRPFFGWVHYFGTHKVEDSLLDLPTKYRHQYSEYAQYYDGKVAFADEQFLAPLADELETLGILDETILVLWSDHGENLHAMEHNLYWGHNWGLDEEVMRTVLIMRGPGLPSREKREDIAQSTDIFPTLLDLTGLPQLNRFEGRTLLSKAPLDDTIVYMENLCQGFVAVCKGRFKLVLSEVDENKSPPKSKLVRRVNLIKETIGKLLPVQLMRNNRHRSDPLAAWWKARGEPEEVLERLLRQGRCELYDLFTDPKEYNNLAAARADIVTELKTLLQNKVDCVVSGQEISMSDEKKKEIEERLKSLGYL